MTRNVHYGANNRPVRTVKGERGWRTDRFGRSLERETRPKAFDKHDRRKPPLHWKQRLFERLGLKDDNAIGEFINSMSYGLGGRIIFVENRGNVYAVRMYKEGTPDGCVCEISGSPGVPSVRLTNQREAERVLRETRDQIRQAFVKTRKWLTIHNITAHKH
ncbi:MAG: hypothetical protein NT157_01930 [Candidatus Micrarchaeota archaeon]|nr:hypothetical protein [Candidatus Micrarchaeota archaeon]